MSTPKLNLPKISGNMTADVVRDLNALADAVDANAAKATELASHKAHEAPHADYVVQKSGDSMTGRLNLRGYSERQTEVTTNSVNVFAGTYGITIVKPTTTTTRTIVFQKMSDMQDVTHSFSTTLIIEQSATPYVVTFYQDQPVKWKDGEIPDLSGASKTYVLTFVTYDQGTTWLGCLVGEF